MIKTIKGFRLGCYPYIGEVGYQHYADVDILITHLPPASTKTSIDKAGTDWGNPDLIEALTKKTLKDRIVLCDHLYSPTGIIDGGYTGQSYTTLVWIV